MLNEHNRRVGEPKVQTQHGWVVLIRFLDIVKVPLWGELGQEHRVNGTAGGHWCPRCMAQVLLLTVNGTQTLKVLGWQVRVIPCHWTKDTGVDPLGLEPFGFIDPMCYGTGTTTPNELRLVLNTCIVLDRLTCTGKGVPKCSRGEHLDFIADQQVEVVTFPSIPCFVPPTREGVPNEPNGGPIWKGVPRRCTFPFGQVTKHLVTVGFVGR